MSYESIFWQARAIADPGERAAYLDRHCPDPGLRREVEALLAAHDQSSPLDRPPPEPGATSAHAGGRAGDGPCEGDFVGPYKLLQRLGEGGMGEVWAAEQREPVRRRVALKLIKPGMDSRQVLARFEAERQALALMEHPNIARVLDAGTTADGRPFFAMELVKGTPVTVFCDARKLNPRGRLDLFVQACRAIQHAHQKGVIHRDIKPSNVLVELHDDVPVVKVIDFGVAKALVGGLTERTLYTAVGSLVGTPAYMAPEQAPSTPSTWSLSTSERKADIAARRGVDAAALARLVRGELDWIALRALEKDRARRYESPAALARDVERHLRHEPVEAGPPSAWYALRKWLRRRNRGPLEQTRRLADRARTMAEASGCLFNFLYAGAEDEARWWAKRYREGKLAAPLYSGRMKEQFALKLDYLCGDGGVTPKGLLEQAGNSRFLKCDALFLLGSVELARGNRAVAARYFRQQDDLKLLLFGAHWLPAGVIADRLEKTQDWPRWITRKR